MSGSKHTPEGRVARVFDDAQVCVTGPNNFLAVFTGPNRIADANECVAAPAMYEALERIAERSGPFSRDPLVHAVNCVEEMGSLADAALAQARGEEVRP